ncbi:MAG: DUF669 domain-containing protein [Bacteriovoracaceae bacterium]
MMFDLTNVEESNGEFKALPAGTYPAFVDGLEKRTSKTGNDYLAVRFKTFGENHANRTLFTNFNIWHANAKPKEIALSQVKSLLKASGVTEFKFKDENEFLDAIATARCTIKINNYTDATYGEKNDIKGYLPLDETAITETSDIPF